MITGTERATLTIEGGGSAVENAIRAHDTRCRDRGGFTGMDLLPESVIVTCGGATGLWRVFPAETDEFGKVALLLDTTNHRAVVLTDLASNPYDEPEERVIATLCASSLFTIRMSPDVAVRIIIDRTRNGVLEPV